eukprot:204577-Pleurochrysis_carterae.AAC.3
MQLDAAIWRVCNSPPKVSKCKVSPLKVEFATSARQVPLVPKRILPDGALDEWHPEAQAHAQEVAHYVPLRTPCPRVTCTSHPLSHSQAYAHHLFISAHRFSLTLFSVNDVSRFTFVNSEDESCTVSWQATNKHTSTFDPFQSDAAAHPSAASAPSSAASNAKNVLDLMHQVAPSISADELRGLRTLAGAGDAGLTRRLTDLGFVKLGQRKKMEQVCALEKRFLFPDAGAW